MTAIVLPPAPEEPPGKTVIKTLWTSNPVKVCIFSSIWHFLSSLSTAWDFHKIIPTFRQTFKQWPLPAHSWPTTIRNMGTRSPSLPKVDKFSNPLLGSHAFQLLLLPHKWLSTAVMNRPRLPWSGIWIFGSLSQLCTWDQDEKSIIFWLKSWKGVTNHLFYCFSQSCFLTNDPLQKWWTDPDCSDLGFGSLSQLSTWDNDEGSDSLIMFLTENPQMESQI